jgi:hypothetical protein
MRKNAPLLSIALVLSACGGSWQDTIKNQAASDFACPESSISLAPVREGVEERSARATGCGRQATYACGSGDCVRNSDVELMAEDSGVSAAVAAFASEHGPALRECAGLVRMSVVFDVSGNVADIPEWEGQRPTARSCVANALVDARLENPPTERYTVELDLSRNDYLPERGAPPPPDPEDPLEEPLPDTSAQARELRAAIDAHSSEVLACSGTERLGIRVAWTVDGTVSIALQGERAGTAEERCVRDALTAHLRAPYVGNPGEIVHVVAQ